MCDPTKVAAELLRQMIVGDHGDMDMRLMRMCAGKLCSRAPNKKVSRIGDKLVDDIEVVDTAVQIAAAPALLSSLRDDALRSLEKMTILARQFA